MEKQNCFCGVVGKVLGKGKLLLWSFAVPRCAAFIVVFYVPQWTFNVDLLITGGWIVPNSCVLSKLSSWDVGTSVLGTNYTLLVLLLDFPVPLLEEHLLLQHLKEVVEARTTNRGGCVLYIQVILEGKGHKNPNKCRLSLDVMAKRIESHISLPVFQGYFLGSLTLFFY